MISLYIIPNGISNAKNFMLGGDKIGKGRWR